MLPNACPPREVSNKKTKRGKREEAQGKEKKRRREQHSRRQRKSQARHEAREDQRKLIKGTLEARKRKADADAAVKRDFWGKDTDWIQKAPEGGTQKKCRTNRIYRRRTVQNPMQSKIHFH